MCFAKKVKRDTQSADNRKSNKNESQDSSIESSHKPGEKQDPAPPLPTPLPQKQNPKAMVVVKPWVRRTLNMGVPALIDEFKGLAKWTPENMTTEAFSANKDKNRYQDVPCQDKGRIVLTFPGLSSDYIHANYLGTAHNPKRFICAQGPLENTQHSFWAMALQEKVECIIMLCNCIEKMKMKCHQYWPIEKDQKMTFGTAPNAINVTNMGARRLAGEETCINVTTLKVEWPEGNRTIQHFQWENWPDRGVPATNLTAINLLSSVRGNQNPILVHCSAGIGRTGSIVSISYIQDKMQAGENCMAMNELLKELRSQRPWSIQNELQYLYVHRVLLAYFLERHKDTYGELLTGDSEAKYAKWIEDYKTATDSK
ncbi:unnamed protein product [Caenorhabditis sp. 36 PRJEB53466]|nr:unnamed protein product [Caenorhabditis sp. 36 PRJEB53466]